MKLSSVGEFGLIERLTRGLRYDRSVVKGVGDDCAVVDFDRTRFMLFCSDMIVEDVDFTLRDRPGLIGRKALAVNLSDIAACAGIPRYCTVSLGLPKRCGLVFAERLYRGIRSLASRFKVNIVGGDISKAAKLTIDVSVIGFVEKTKLALRSGARPGDIICVSGKLGNSLAGKHLQFTPRVGLARWLACHCRLHAMIDISDGLAADLGHILVQSKAGARLYARCIPCVKGLDAALHDGEDFELLFTLAPREAKKALAAGRGISAIGEIVAPRYGVRLVDAAGRESMLEPKGYRHF